MIKRIITYMTSAVTILLISACGSVPGKIVETPKADYGLDTYSSYNGLPMTIGQNTQTLEYNGRSFYFDDSADLQRFRENPQQYVLKFELNETPKIIAPLKSDYGLRTSCSYNGNPIVVTNYTPTLSFLGRIYYFAHTETMKLFMDNPQIYIAKFPANKVPKIISPLKSDYGSKMNCAATGTPILVGPHTPAVEYLGRIFYFSNLQGMQAFKQDPQKYITMKFNLE